MNSWHRLASGEMPKLRMDKLAGCGFQRYEDGFRIEKKVLAGAFLLRVHVSNEGEEVFTQLLDTDTGEAYVLHLVDQAEGAFVGQVKAAYDKELAAIAANCSEHGSFHGEYMEALLSYVRSRYGDDIEYPWKDLDSAVIRSHLTQKWYAVFMKVLPIKIGLDGKQPIRIMDLHGKAEAVSQLVDGVKYFPGYHMNKKYWYTLCLDGTVPIEELKTRIDESFILSQKK